MITAPTGNGSSTAQLDESPEWMQTSGNDTLSPTLLRSSTKPTISKSDSNSDLPLVRASERFRPYVYSSSVYSEPSPSNPVCEAGLGTATKQSAMSREKLASTGFINIDDKEGTLHVLPVNAERFQAPGQPHNFSRGADGILDTRCASHSHHTSRMYSSKEMFDHSHSSGRCCSPSLISNEVSSLRELDRTATDKSDSSDLERGPPNIERIVLRIKGLKCGCCGTSITRAVTRIHPIGGHYLNLVTARLELDLDTNRMPVAKVIERLDTKTGYTFEQHPASDGQVLEFIISDSAIIRQAGVPYGVSHLEVPEKEPWRPLQLLSGRSSTVPCGGTPLTTKNTSKEPQVLISAIVDNERPAKLFGTSPISRQLSVRIHYDANTIGARDIFDYYRNFDPSLKLAPPSENTIAGARTMRRALYIFIPTLALTIPVVVLAWAPVNPTKLAYSHISLVLATVVQFIAFYEFLPNASRTLYHSHMFDMDALIALSTSIAYAFSVVSYVFQLRGKPLETGSFFETSTLLVTLILLGRAINEFARYRAAKSVSFRSLQIDEAILAKVNPELPLDPDPKTTKVDARLLQYGDHFKVPPHTKVVTDGVVVYGGSEVDESMITGESIPVAKGVQSKVYAGTNNGSGTLIVKLTALPHENSVHKIAAMVEDAELTKPKIQALADRIASWFVPVIACMGLSVFLIWLFVERYYTKHSWKSAVVTAITYAIATLIVSCPCAIGLAVPMVVLISGGVAARFGIIFRDPQKFEVARNVTDVVFDKTGTLTCGTPTVWEDQYFYEDPARIKGLLLSLLKDINHPVSVGVLHHLEKEARQHPEQCIQPLEVSKITSLPGRGLIGAEVSTGFEIRAGSAEWLSLAMPQQTSTLLCITINSSLAATFKLTDRARPTAEAVVSSLLTRGINVHMLSGDNQGSVDYIAFTANIPKRHTKATCSPDDKRAYIQTLQKQGKIVLFIGDGTNDAIALKQADVGVHIPQSTSSHLSTLSTTPSASSPPNTTTPQTNDIAKSAADIHLTSPRLQDLLTLLDISAAAYRRIVFNFSWSALYNVFAVLLSAGAFVRFGGQKVRIEPRWAGLGELVSVLPVVGGAFSMGWRGRGRGRGRRDDISEE